jgi:hypothetical protein
MNDVLRTTTQVICPLSINFKCRPVESVRCSSDPKFAFFKFSSNVRKSHGKFDGTLLHYACNNKSICLTVVMLHVSNDR